MSCAKRASRRSSARTIPRFRILGYTDRMHELMQISDLFIGKPGGLTTSEALACGLPMAIVSPIPGQEERNSDHLLEEGIAIKCNELTTLPFKIDRLLDDPPRLARMAKMPARWAGRTPRDGRRDAARRRSRRRSSSARKSEKPSPTRRRENEPRAVYRLDSKASVVHGQQ